MSVDVSNGLSDWSADGWDLCGFCADVVGTVCDGLSGGSVRDKGVGDNGGGSRGGGSRCDV